MLYAAPASGQPRVLASATPARLTTLMLLLQGVSSGHRL